MAGRFIFQAHGVLGFGNLLGLPMFINYDAIVKLLSSANEDRAFFFAWTEQAYSATLSA